MHCTNFQCCPAFRTFAFRLGSSIGAVASFLDGYSNRIKFLLLILFHLLMVTHFHSSHHANKEANRAKGRPEISPLDRWRIAVCILVWNLYSIWLSSLYIALLFYHIFHLSGTLRVTSHLRYSRRHCRVCRSQIHHSFEPIRDSSFSRLLPVCSVVHGLFTVFRCVTLLTSRYDPRHLPTSYPPRNDVCSLFVSYS